MHYHDDELIRIFNRSDGRCLYCGRELTFSAHQNFCQRGTWVVDRFIPTEQGGPDEFTNWVASCPACSYEKGTRLPWEFDPGRFEAGETDPGRQGLEIREAG